MIATYGATIRRPELSCTISLEPARRRPFPWYRFGDAAIAAAAAICGAGAITCLIVGIEMAFGR